MDSVHGFQKDSLGGGHRLGTRGLTTTKGSADVRCLAFASAALGPPVLVLRRRRSSTRAGAPGARGRLGDGLGDEHRVRRGRRPMRHVHLFEEELSLGLLEGREQAPAMMDADICEALVPKRVPQDRRADRPSS